MSSVAYSAAFGNSAALTTIQIQAILSEVTAKLEAAIANLNEVDEATAGYIARLAG